MGDRGTFAAGNSVAYKYETVSTIEGVKVLQPIENGRSFKLPEESHSSQKYILLDKGGTFRQYREYNSNHKLTFEIGYHNESGISKAGESVLHFHSFAKPGIDYRQKAKPITDEIFKKYKRYFKGVK